MAEPPSSMSNMNTSQGQIHMSDPPVSEASMSKGPEQLQALVASFTRGDLMNLRALIAPRTHFDFLGLPLELREAVYELDITTHTKTGFIRKAKGNEKRLGPISLLLVCHQLSMEARNVLYRETACRLTLRPKRRVYGYELDHQIRNPFLNFRQVELTIRADNYYVEYKQSQEGSFGYLLGTLANALAMAHGSCGEGPARSLHLTFELRWYEVLEISTLSKSCSHSDREIIWFRTQAAAAVADMREELKSLVPTITLTSNVESAIKHVNTRRVNAHNILFRYGLTQGAMSVQTNGKRPPHTIWMKYDPRYPL